MGRLSSYSAAQHPQEACVCEWSQRVQLLGTCQEAESVQSVTSQTTDFQPTFKIWSKQRR